MSVSNRILALLLLAGAAVHAQPVNPEIVINNDTGVNGQASGAPGNQAAVFNANCCHTNGSGSTTITCTAHGFGGFPTDGSAALWLATASGRRWTKITGFPSADTITVQDSFNVALASAVDCAVGGQIAGALANVTRLCADVKAGWTLTLENTGTPYTDSGTCPLTSGFTSTNSEGVILVRGDDPDNPTPILYQTNGNYLTLGNNIRAKAENLEFRKDVAGTAGAFASGVFTIVKNVVVSAAQGTWNQAFGGALAANPGVVLQSQTQGAFTANCGTLDDNDLFIANFLNGCSGNTAAFMTPGQALFLFNLIDNGGAAQATFSSATNNGFGGVLLYNTLLNAGGSGITSGANFGQIVSGNLIGEGATLSGACFNAGTGAANMFGFSGEPHGLWLGNAANTCTTARYGGGLDTTEVGAATDLLAGAQFNPLFRDEGSLDFFPLAAAAKSNLVFPGSAFPLLTPAEPSSTMTAGAAQLFGSGGASAYAY